MMISVSALPERHSLFEHDSILVDGVLRPVTNSEGRLIADTPEAQRNFWRWFGDSKVVDVKGQPLVVYHGTGSDISKFNGRSYLTACAAQAGDYAANRAEANGHPNVIPIYVSLQSPHIASTDYIEWAGYEAVEIDRSIGDGFDGFINDSMTEIVVFSPQQIKSAIGNSGAFDPYSPFLTDSLPSLRWHAEQLAYAERDAGLSDGLALEIYREAAAQDYSPNDPYWRDVGAALQEVLSSELRGGAEFYQLLPDAVMGMEQVRDVAIYRP